MQDLDRVKIEVEEKNGGWRKSRDYCIFNDGFQRCITSNFYFHYIGSLSEFLRRCLLYSSLRDQFSRLLVFCLAGVFGQAGAIC